MALPALLTFLPKVLDAVASVFSSYMERKKVEAQGRVDISKARVDGQIKLATTQLEGDIDYNSKIADGMQFSWKDEWFTVLLSVPAILCFIPGMDSVVSKGFDALAKTPDWYQWCFMGAIVASFGLKAWTGWKNGNGNGHAATAVTPTTTTAAQIGEVITKNITS